MCFIDDKQDCVVIKCDVFCRLPLCQDYLVVEWYACFCNLLVATMSGLSCD